MGFGIDHIGLTSIAVFGSYKSEIERVGNVTDKFPGFLDVPIGGGMLAFYETLFATCAVSCGLFVARLRRKLGVNIIKTIRGLGYRLEEPG